MGVCQWLGWGPWPPWLPVKPERGWFALARPQSRSRSRRFITGDGHQRRPATNGLIFAAWWTRPTDRTVLFTFTRTSAKLTPSNKCISEKGWSMSSNDIAPFARGQHRIKTDVTPATKSQVWQGVSHVASWRVTQSRDSFSEQNAALFYVTLTCVKDARQRRATKSQLWHAYGKVNTRGHSQWSI